MKKTYFLITESAFLATLSIFLFAESAMDFTVSAAALAVESTLFTVESTDALEPEPFEQAAKEPIANTNKTFFMFNFFLFVMNGLILIPQMLKSNPK
jgi:hypothetical protein